MAEEKVDDWVACKDRLPSNTSLVKTKIDDQHGVRNEATLWFYRNLWWAGEGRDAMYVYYSPTHWKPLRPDHQ